MSDNEQFFSCSESDESDFEFPPPLAPETRSPGTPQSQRATGSPRSKCAGRSRERCAAEVRPPYVSCGAATAATYVHPRPAARPAQAPFYHPRPAARPAQAPFYHPRPAAGQAQAPRHPRPAAGQAQAPRYPRPVARQAQAPRHPRPVASQAKAPRYPRPVAGQAQPPPPPLTPDPLLVKRGHPPTLNPLLKRGQQSRRSCNACEKQTNNFARRTSKSPRNPPKTSQNSTSSGIASGSSMTGWPALDSTQHPPAP